MREQKGDHSLISNARYVFSVQWKTCGISLLLLLLSVPVALGITLCEIMLPQTAVAQFVNGSSLENALLSVTYLCVSLIALKWIRQMIDTLNFSHLTNLKHHFVCMRMQKSLKTAYVNIESADFRNLMERANEATASSGYGSPVERMSKDSIGLLTSVLGYLMLGSILLYANPLIAAVLTILPVIHFFINRKIQNYQYKVKDQTVKLDRKLWYIARNAETRESAMDIRIYSMKDWLTDKFNSLSRSRVKWDYKITKKYTYASAFESVMVFLRDGIALCILIDLSIKGTITVDEFVLYFMAIGAFSETVSGILQKSFALFETSMYITDYRRFLDYPEINDTATKVISPDGIQPHICYKHVYFTYPGADKETIQDISFDVAPGEKIAIVGPNGAGKTTLIKMLCGLYHPSRGEISINGTSLRDVMSDSLFKLFGVVFQDTHIMPVSIANVIAGKEASPEDSGRIEKCLQFAGLDKKTAALKEGFNQKLNRQINPDGIELSGGEYQRLLLARAMYKDSPVLILDEPTAALDPIAERELYYQYNNAFINKTVFYISHRLASTQFCDRIFYLEDGKITETGTHSELLARNGAYARLFNIQSKYFTEAGEAI